MRVGGKRKRQLTMYPSSSRPLVWPPLHLATSRMSYAHVWMEHYLQYSPLLPPPPPSKVGEKLWKRIAIYSPSLINFLAGLRTRLFPHTRNKFLSWPTIPELRTEKLFFKFSYLLLFTIWFKILTGTCAGVLRKYFADRIFAFFVSYNYLKFLIDYVPCVFKF